MSGSRLKSKTAVVRRLEVPVGDLGRRRWPDEVKAGSSPSRSPGAVVAGVARRHGLTPQQLFAWRRRARQEELAAPVPDQAPFAPVVLAAVGEAVGRIEAAPATGGAGVIEIRLGSAIVRVGAEVTGEHLTRVLLAVKAAG